MTKINKLKFFSALGACSIIIPITVLTVISCSSVDKTKNNSTNNTNSTPKKESSSPEIQTQPLISDEDTPLFIVSTNSKAILIDSSIPNIANLQKDTNWSYKLYITNSNIRNSDLLEAINDDKAFLIKSINSTQSNVSFSLPLWSNYLTEIGKTLGKNFNDANGLNGSTIKYFVVASGKCISNNEEYQPTILNNSLGIVKFDNQTTYINATINNDVTTDFYQGMNYTFVLNNPSSSINIKNLVWKISSNGSYNVISNENKNDNYSLNYTFDTPGYYIISLTDGNFSTSYTINVLPIASNLSIQANGLVDNVITINNGSDVLLNLNWEINNISLTNASISYQWYVKQYDPDNTNGIAKWKLIDGSNSISYNAKPIYVGYECLYKAFAIISFNNQSYKVVSNVVSINYIPNIENGEVTYKWSSNDNDAKLISTNTIASKVSSVVSLTGELNNNIINSSTLSYQWQQFTNGTWTTVSNSKNYEVTIQNRMSKYLFRFEVSLLNNWNYSPWYSDTITVQSDPISSEDISNVQNAINKWLTTSNEENLMTNYFQNQGSNFILNQLAQWGYGWQLQTTNGIALNNSSIKTSEYLKIGQVNINSQNNIVLSVTTLQPIKISAWQNAQSSVSIPANTSFSVVLPYSFSPVGNYTVNGTDWIHFTDSKVDITNLGQVSLILYNTIVTSNISQQMQQIVSSLEGGYSYGIYFNEPSIVNELNNSSFFGNNSSYTSFGTVSYNNTTIKNYVLPFNLYPNDAKLTLTSTNSTLPNFTLKVLGFDPYQPEEKISIITSNNLYENTLNLAKGGSSGLVQINAYLNNGANTSFSYVWTRQLEGSSDIETIQNSTNSLSIQAPSNLTNNETYLYYCKIETTYEGTTYSTVVKITVNFSTGANITGGISPH